VEIQTGFLSNTSPEVFLPTRLSRINLKIKNFYHEKQAAPELTQCILVTFNLFILRPFAVSFSPLSTEPNNG
jgi:hypothetical protein